MSTPHAPRFFSLKWRALVIFSLLLLAITSFSTVYVSGHLLSQFEAERESRYNKQVRELEGLVRQSSATLQGMTEVVPLISGLTEQFSSLSSVAARKEFTDRWQSLQLAASFDLAQLYDTQGAVVQSSKSDDIEYPDSELIHGYIREVSRTEQPLTFLDCTHKCLQLAVAPMLSRGKNSGIVVLGATLAAGIVSFKNISGVDVGLLNVADSVPATPGDDRRVIARWHARISALTNFEQNLPLLHSVAARLDSPAAIGTGLRESAGGREFEIHLLPVEKFAVRGNAYFVLIDDITSSHAQVREGIWRNVAVGVTGLVLSELILLLILWQPLSRLRRMADLLPLLVQNAFGQIRQAVAGTPRRGRYRDEFDVLDDTFVAVSGQLERLQAEVAQRAADLSSANQSLAKLNQELEQKVRERTQQLLDAQEELVRREKLAVLGQVAASVGHELRNPLSVMSNAVYFLQTVLGDGNESIREYLNIIKNEITSSDRIVSELLDSVRTRLPQPQDVGIGDLMHQTLDKCALPSNVTVRLDIPVALPAVRIDPLQIQQVLRNLISNGVEAMPDGGRLEISAVQNPSEGTVTVNVRDTGVGMTPEQMTKLFQPLFTTKARGIGLGLVVVRNLTQANGGSVRVHSEFGKGSVFSITLPIPGRGGRGHD